MTLLKKGLARLLAPRRDPSRTAADGSSEPSDAQAESGPPSRKYSEAASLLARQRPGGWAPTDFSVNLGVAPCNHACLFCPQSVHKPEKARWLDLDILRKVLTEMPEDGVQIGLSAYMETIAAPNLVPAVRLMKEVRPGIRVAMASNGTLFREDVIEELMDAGLDHYSYSFDAATAGDYTRMMQKDDFDRVWENLEKLVALRARKGSDMVVTTHIMAFRGREADFEKFKEYWDDKVDFVQWRAVANWGGDNWGLEKQLAGADFVPVHQAPPERYPCFSIMHHFKLNWDGYYYPCVAAVPDYERELQNHSVPHLGNARDVTWQEAWQRLEAMRRAHIEGRWDDYECCKSCNVWSVYDSVWSRRATAGREDGGFEISRDLVA